MLLLFAFFFKKREGICSLQPVALALIVSFTAAIVNARWSLLFSVSPGYHCTFKSWCAPTPSRGVNKQIKQSCCESTGKQQRLDIHSNEASFFIVPQLLDVLPEQVNSCFSPGGLHVAALGPRPALWSRCNSFL